MNPTQPEIVVTNKIVEDLAAEWFNQCQAQRLQDGLDPFTFMAKKYLEELFELKNAPSKFILMPPDMQDKVIFTLWSFACNSHRKEAQKFMLDNKDSLEMARVMILQALENLHTAIKQTEYLEGTKR